MKKIKKLQIKEVISETKFDNYILIYKDLIILNYKKRQYKYEKEIYCSRTDDYIITDDHIIDSIMVTESIQGYTTKKIFYFINELEITLPKDDVLYWFFEPHEAAFTNIDDKEFKSLYNKIFFFPIKTYKEANLIYEVLND